MTDRRHALAFNAIGPALKAHDAWLSLSTRQALATAVLAAIDEEPVAGVRDSARQATAQPAAEVASLAIPRDAAEAVHAVLGDLLRPLDARRAVGQPDPTVADDPVRLRWGLNDVMWGDDDTITICMSGPGPDYLPYWLELDPERANVLRQDLAGPDTEPQDHPGAELYTQLRKAGNDHDTTNRLIYAHARMAIRQHEALNDTTPAVGQQDATQPTTDRCPSCEHSMNYHAADNGRCWFTVEQGMPDRDSVCACLLRRLAAGAES